MADSTPIGNEAKSTKEEDRNANKKKYISLAVLTLQQAIVGLCMRWAAIRTSKEDRFISSTAVFMAEVVKFSMCLIALMVQNRANVMKVGREFYDKIIDKKLDTLKVGIPALMFVGKNNLQYIGTAHLEAATYQVIYQMRILPTAIFAVLFLRKKLRWTQWLALVILCGGVAMVTLAESESKPGESKTGQNHMIGIAAVCGAALSSSLAYIFFEKMLKVSGMSVWMRNIQLCLFSIPLGLIPCFAFDYEKIRTNGFFHGYDWFVWIVVLLNAMNSLITAIAVKYADSIWKGFATILAIFLVAIGAMIWFDFHLTLLFCLGALLVIVSTCLYAFGEKQKMWVRKRKPKFEATTKGFNMTTIEEEREPGSAK